MTTLASAGTGESSSSSSEAIPAQGSSDASEASDARPSKSPEDLHLRKFGPWEALTSEPLPRFCGEAPSSTGWVVPAVGLLF